jgi:hypothetical protein
MDFEKAYASFEGQLPHGDERMNMASALVDKYNQKLRESREQLAALGLVRQSQDMMDLQAKQDFDTTVIDSPSLKTTPQRTTSTITTTPPPSYKSPATIPTAHTAADSATRFSAPISASSPPALSCSPSLSFGYARSTSTPSTRTSVTPTAACNLPSLPTALFPALQDIPSVIFFQT